MCPHCGAQIGPNDEVCPKCLTTVVVLSPVENKQKSPRIAAVASVVWPGLGQLYIGRTLRGVLFIVFAAVFAAFVALGTPTIYDLGLLVFIVIWIYGIFDAYNTARAIDEGAL